MRHPVRTFLAVMLMTLSICTSAWAIHESDTNTWIGTGAGSAISTGTLDSFFGYNAGLEDSSEGSNCFFGFEAGLNTAPRRFDPAARR